MLIHTTRTLSQSGYFNFSSCPDTEPIVIPPDATSELALPTARGNTRINVHDM